MKQRNTYILNTLQKLMQKMKQIVRPQHSDDFSSSWGRKEGARARDGKGCHYGSENMRMMGVWREMEGKGEIMLGGLIMTEKESEDKSNSRLR